MQSINNIFLKSRQLNIEQTASDAILAITRHFKRSCKKKSRNKSSVTQIILIARFAIDAISNPFNFPCWYPSLFLLFFSHFASPITLRCVPRQNVCVFACGWVSGCEMRVSKRRNGDDDGIPETHHRARSGRLCIRLWINRKWASARTTMALGRGTSIYVMDNRWRETDWLTRGRSRRNFDGRIKGSVRAIR